MAICVAPFRTLSSSVLRSGTAAAAPCSAKSTILGCPNALRTSLKIELSSRPSSGGRMNCYAQAAGTGEHLKLVGGFTWFSCNGMWRWCRDWWAFESALKFWWVVHDCRVLECDDDAGTGEHLKILVGLHDCRVLECDDDSSFFVVADVTASAPFLTDHAKLIDSVETFIFDCDGMWVLVWRCKFAENSTISHRFCGEIQLEGWYAGVIWKGDSLIEGVPETLDLLRSMVFSQSFLYHFWKFE